MEYQKIITLDNTQIQPTRFRTKNWVEINYDSRPMYNTNSEIKFKTSLLTSSLCDNSGAYLLVSKTITIVWAGADDAAKRVDGREKGVIFKNCVPFTDCISEINNAQIDSRKHLDVVMSMYNLIEYKKAYGRIIETSQMII